MQTHQQTVLRNGVLQFTTTVYRPDQPARGIVLALHGFPDGPLTFEKLARDLVVAGYAVVVPVMRGYELSSIPADRDYQMASLANDVAAWLEQEPMAGQRVHLLGHDWGAVAGYAAAGLLGERLASFTALAIPPLGGALGKILRSPRQLGLFWYQYLALIPVISEACFSRSNFSLLELLWRRWSPDMQPPERLLEAVRARFRIAGVLTSALRYYRSLYSYHRSARWRTERLFAAPIHAPTLILNGVNDGCMDAGIFPLCIRDARFVSGVRHETLAGCGHWLHHEKPCEVMKHLLAHLDGAVSVP